MFPVIFLWRKEREKKSSWTRTQELTESFLGAISPRGALFFALNKVTMTGGRINLWLLHDACSESASDIARLRVVLPTEVSEVQVQHMRTNANP
jgi:hypothetical protein